MLHGMWKKLVSLMLCISLCCMGTVTCLAEETGGTDSSATDYSDESNWLAKPEVTKEVDTFYIYPTAYFDTSEGAPDVCSIDSDILRTEAAIWYQRALDAGYEPDEEDQKHLAEVLGEQTGEDHSVVGGWEMIPHEAEALPEDAQAAFDKAVDGLTGETYTPVALMATQVVAGKNYCILCQISPEVPDSQPKWALVYIYADLQGNAEIINVYELYIDQHSGL